MMKSYFIFAICLLFLAPTAHAVNPCEDALWGLRIYATEPPNGLVFHRDSFLLNKHRGQTIDLGDLMLLTVDQLKSLPEGTVVETVSGHHIIIGQGDLNLEYLQWTSELTSVGFPVTTEGRRRMLNHIAPSLLRMVADDHATSELKLRKTTARSDNELMALDNEIVEKYLAAGQPHAAFPHLIEFVQLKFQKYGEFAQEDINHAISRFFSSVRDRNELKEYFKDFMRRALTMFPVPQYPGRNSSWFRGGYNERLLAGFGIHITRAVPDIRGRIGREFLSISNRELIGGVLEMVRDGELDEWLQRNGFDRIRILTYQYNFTQIAYLPSTEPAGGRNLNWSTGSLLQPEMDRENHYNQWAVETTVSRIESALSPHALAKVETLGIADFGAVIKGGWPQTIAARLLDGLGYVADIYARDQMYYVQSPLRDKAKEKLFTRVLKALQLLADNNYVVVVYGSMNASGLFHQKQQWGVLSREAYMNIYSGGIGHDLVGRGLRAYEGYEMNGELVDAVTFVETELGYIWNGSSWVKTPLVVTP